MEIKINVDEVKFKEIIEKELDAFSREELHEIIRECIIDALRSNDELRKLFITENNNGYYTTKEPSEILKLAAKSIDLSPAYKEIQDSMITTLKENYHELLEKVMLSMVMNGLTNDWDFRERMANNVAQILSNRSNQ